MDIFLYPFPVLLHAHKPVTVEVLPEVIGCLKVCNNMFVLLCHIIFLMHAYSHEPACRKVESKETLKIIELLSILTTEYLVAAPDYESGTPVVR